MSLFHTLLLLVCSYSFSLEATNSENYVSSEICEIWISVFIMLNWQEKIFVCHIASQGMLYIFNLTRQLRAEPQHLCQTYPHWKSNQMSHSPERRELYKTVNKRLSSLKNLVMVHDAMTFWVSELISRFVYYQDVYF